MSTQSTLVQFARLPVASVFALGGDGVPRIKLSHNLYFQTATGATMGSAHLAGRHGLEVLLEPKSPRD